MTTWQLKRATHRINHTRSENHTEAHLVEDCDRAGVEPGGYASEEAALTAATLVEAASDCPFAVEVETEIGMRSE